MAAGFAAIIELGPWALVLFGIAAYFVARSKGYLVTKDEVDRHERRVREDAARNERNVDRTLKLYETQLQLLSEANRKKDETIERQSGQLERLLRHSDVTSYALSEIVGEATRRDTRA